MSSEKTAIEDRLALLKTRFADSTTTQLTELLHTFSTPKQASTQDIAQLYQLLHRLAGSSGTFGFHQLGQQAARLEKAMTPLVTHARSSTPEVEQLINADFLALLQQLPHLLQQEASAPVSEVAHSVTPRTHHTKLLVIGQELASLVTALTAYGFTIDHCDQPVTRCEQGWDRADIIITPAHQLTATVSWNNEQANKHHQACADILCVGVEDTFAARYALAAQGAKGLFTWPINVPKIAERIEQISAERHQKHASKVLLLDDDIELAEHYRLVLTAAGKEVTVLHSPENILTRLAEFRPDIILLDVHLPPYSGITLARMIRLEPEWLSLPIIYLSSEQDRDQQILALAQGADEFITKPISDWQLVSSVRALCYRAQTLAKLLSCDGLTGLLNHTHIKQALHHEYARVQRYGHTTSLAILDLDHFKQVNDRYGHSAGDQVIKALASLLQHRLRNTDHIGRYGGEEFVVILSECTQAQALLMFNDICHHFARLTFNNGHTEFNVTVSVGLTELNLFTAVEQALNAADEALYQRKHQGRNGVSCYSPKDVH